MKKIENIKVIFVDIDGTLTNSEKQITDYTKKVIDIASKNGIYVVLCSGRANSYVCEYSKKCSASNYVISSNGAQIYDYEKNINIFESKIEFSDVEKIWNYLLENEIECFLNTKDIRYCNKYLKDKNDPMKKMINDINIINEIGISQIVAYSDNYESLKK